MDEMEVTLFNGIYSNKKVLITGNSGFKGSWLALWLQQLGAEILGLSLKPKTNPNHFELLGLPYKTIYHDINDSEKVKKVILDFQPDIVFHLAAQSIVKTSYEDPIDTFRTNIIGTINILEACRYVSKDISVVCITSDKCYKNKEWVWGYRESDELGGYDPYSASKACAEIAISSYKNSFFNNNQFLKNHRNLISSVRAGNVIGGGDWSLFRLIPDIIKAAKDGNTVIIRNPDSTRPWQHVLEPLSGYLLLGTKLLSRNLQFTESWNFGPGDINSFSVRDIILKMQKYWEKVNFTIVKDDYQVESSLLKLDCSKANKLLNWFSIWDMEKTIEKTITWYKNYYEQKDVLPLDLSLNDLYSYIKDANIKKAIWSL